MTVQKLIGRNIIDFSLLEDPKENHQNDIFNEQDKIVEDN
jgi:hypothetical protein